METVINPSATGTTVVDTDRSRGGHNGHSGHSGYDSDWARAAERVKDALSAGLSASSSERNSLAFRSVDQVSQILLAIQAQQTYLQSSFDVLQAKMASEAQSIRDQLKQKEIDELKEQVSDLKALKSPKVLPV